MCDSTAVGLTSSTQNKRADQKLINELKYLLWSRGFRPIIKGDTAINTEITEHVDK